MTIDYELFLDCVHCGLCTAACPTYLELGNENDSPRGRIYLMRAVTDGRLQPDSTVRRHLDLCLDCRACESACPSGVQYGRLIEPFRIALEKDSPSELPWLMKLMLLDITPYPVRLQLALAPARLLQWLGLDRMLLEGRLSRLVPKIMRQMLAVLPRLGAARARLPQVLLAEGKRRARVALFTGCAGDVFYPQTNVATARVLQKNGCEVWIPPAQVCCGALHYHAAHEKPARNFARRNNDVFGPALPEIDAIVVNAAGCGAMLKDYGHLLGDAGGQGVAAKVRDISEFLIELGPVPPTHPLQLKAVYHDACHLCHGQQIRQPPRQLLQLIPGLQLLPLRETEVCCGAAGSYNLTQPEMSQRLGQRKARNILETGAEAVFTGNVGCIMQIARSLDSARSAENITRSELSAINRPKIWVAHPIEALWASYAQLKVDKPS
jgi:glycolate oxidase iron-sulfur subunit